MKNPKTNKHHHCCIIPALKQHGSKKVKSSCAAHVDVKPRPSLAIHQCLVSIKSARRLSLFRVSYPTTMSTDVGREEMMRADSPLVIPQTPSSASSCLKVSMTDERPSTFNRKGEV